MRFGNPDLLLLLACILRKITDLVFSFIKWRKIPIFNRIAKEGVSKHFL